MDNAIDNIIAELDASLTCLPMNFENDSWRSTIPPGAGWYLIMTNMPIDELKSIGLSQHRVHINIPRIIENTSSLSKLGIAIRQSSDRRYVVYNGEAANLKARAREHIRGHAKTFCLGLSEYEAICRYEWRFCYTAVSSCKGLNGEDKLLRIAVEQGWRAKHGWPVLCSR